MANSLITRAISGAIYVALIVGCILGGEYWVMLLSTLFAILAGIELTKITVGLQSSRNVALILDLGALMTLSYGPSVRLGVVWVCFIVLRMVWQLYSKNENPLRSLGLSLGMQLYIGLPCWLMSGMAQLPSFQYVNEKTLLALFILIWLNDTSAYLVGSKFGRHRLCERLSPKKSIEGSVGGLIFNVVASVLFCAYCPTFFGLPGNYGLWIGLAVVVTLFATWGDLFESMIKRTLKIKDSGHLIPGHGGILDRIDSFLMVMPASAIYFYFFLLH